MSPYESTTRTADPDLSGENCESCGMFVRCGRIKKSSSKSFLKLEQTSILNPEEGNNQ